MHSRTAIKGVQLTSAIACVSYMDGPIDYSKARYHSGSYAHPTESIHSWVRQNEGIGSLYS